MRPDSSRGRRPAPHAAVNNHGRKEKVNGRDVLTKWDGQRLISETTVGDTKVTDTYERSPSAPQLIVTTRMDMRGHGVSVRRVYDAASVG